MKQSTKKRLNLPTRRGLYSPLKWPGSKRELPRYWKDWILADSSCRRWVEPFGGSLSLPFEICPHSALIGDINPDLINFWSWIKTGKFRFPAAMGQFDEPGYYALRKQFNGLNWADRGWSLEAAQLFYLLTRSSFNGLIRYNQKKEYNASYGGDSRSGRHSQRERGYQCDFPRHAEAMKFWELRVDSYNDLCRWNLEPSDFLLLDPPYVAEPGRKDEPFEGYWINRFDWPEQIDLARWAGKHEGPTYAFNAWEPRIIRIWEDQGFTIHQIEMPRSISRDGATRGKKPEMLAIRNGGPK